MRYRDRLILMMGGVVVLTGVLVVALSYMLTRGVLLDAIRSQVLSIAATAATAIDPQIHERIVTADDQGGPDYEHIERQLRDILNANRRDDVQLRFVYTGRPLPDDPTRWSFVVDAEEPGPEKSYVGQVWTPHGRVQEFRVGDLTTEFAADEFGTWLSGSAPIRDASGRAVAFIGVDMEYERVLGKTNALLIGGIAAMAVAVAAVAALAIVLSRLVTRPIEQACEVARRIGNGDLTAKFHDTGSREFAALAAALNSMTQQLRDRVKLRESLALAMEVQQGLLPAESPAIDGLDIAGRSIYCDQTGGDYYDYLDLSEVGPGAVGVAVGDVVGHGVAAALLMTTARAILRSHASRPGELGELMTQMNRLLSSDTGAGGRFMTLLFMIIDRHAGTIRWVNAGHEPALLFDTGTREFIDLQGGDIPLGIEPSYRFEELRFAGLREGQVLLLGTDGIWESRDPQGRWFGKKILRDLLREHADKPAEQIAGIITTALDRFRGSRPQEDDVTLVVIKVEPTMNNAGALAGKAPESPPHDRH